MAVGTSLLAAIGYAIFIGTYPPLYLLFIQNLLCISLLLCPRPFPFRNIETNPLLMLAYRLEKQTCRLRSALLTDHRCIRWRAVSEHMELEQCAAAL